ncbi:tRNA (cytidine(34)-2'-O)-methyltransferase [Corynebacterium pygosceleis]|uniref:Putative tRNA (cytidine(34)-2'-O)-methyltransferase n=1 Tax=Corynebacterium pygosceleis TaxID=2800406 RepID=A0A9Q4C7S7_9CORY|nr:tRNA (cytidine(34)-2'-O)-methyltransferase [Corynebacterium pygosceleis]MCK7637614.1 tRNA (cytidine(34)-2'-O)-methyltransferase [Corynebacterium pygosceleis]MCK7674805.1 tRNA (cytidine(34)-2'-O)-methyltransferase [Corynebacterium pygosceleis]MCL0119606.1 tRNA (cytidine(34)-2'-O)-methyltransferase [Corynebacterium pygosceleis]MCX7444847.1 tRNA (cytidine(34)-2'-O)-methyltransferase [Corynebacterium pygosceleis]MCX7468057.1 tRNA (cytidine(34)-2'-O)-methyltransferase [Corynebacterium pygoscelei
MSEASDPGDTATLHIIFDRPCIPPNTGNAIRMCAGTGAHLHLAGPLGFNLEEKNLRRAGLDYHDLARVSVHENLAAAFAALPGARVFAFTTSATRWHGDISYRPGDVLLFGTEPTGLDGRALSDPRITGRVRVPMLPGRRSMNLSNCAAVAAYEAWRQLGYPGAV